MSLIAIYQQLEKAFQIPDEKTRTAVLEAIEIYSVDEDDKTLLMLAAAIGNIQITTYLIAKFKGTNFINVINEKQQSALMIAAGYGHQEIVELLAEYADAEHINKAFVHAARFTIQSIQKEKKRNSIVMRYLFEQKKANINSTDELGKTILIIGAECFSFLEGLFKTQGALIDVNYVNKAQSETALIAAVKQTRNYAPDELAQKRKIVQLLLNNGADPCLVMADNTHALLHSLYDIDIFKLILAKIPDEQEQNKKLLNQVLDLTVRKEQLRNVQLLLEKCSYSADQYLSGFITLGSRTYTNEKSKNDNEAVAVSFLKHYVAHEDCDLSAIQADLHNLIMQAVIQMQFSLLEQLLDLQQDDQKHTLESLVQTALMVLKRPDIASGLIYLIIISGKDTYKNLENWRIETQLYYGVDLAQLSEEKMAEDYLRHLLSLKPSDTTHELINSARPYEKKIVNALLSLDDNNTDKILESAIKVNPKGGYENGLALFLHTLNADHREGDSIDKIQMRIDRRKTIAILRAANTTGNNNTALLVSQLKTLPSDEASKGFPFFIALALEHQFIITADLLIVEMIKTAQPTKEHLGQWPTITEKSMAQRYIIHFKSLSALNAADFIKVAGPYKKLIIDELLLTHDEDELSAYIAENGKYPALAAFIRTTYSPSWSLWSSKDDSVQKITQAIQNRTSSMQKKGAGLELGKY